MRPVAIIGLLAAAGWPRPATAETVTELPPLIVSAERGSVLPQRYAGHATVVEEEEIAASGACSLGELLSVQPGLRITSATGDNARGAVSLRGFGENPGARALLLVDGRPMNRPDMAAANLAEIPLSRIARVEILRGSQTARFGDQAIGGVINIVTRQASGAAKTAVESAAGADQWLMGRVHHSAGAADRSHTLNAEYNRSDGWRENSDTETWSLASTWTARPRAGLELSGGVSWTELSGRFPGPLTEAQYRANPRQSIYSGPLAEQYASEQSTFRADLSSSLDAGPLGELTSPASWTYRDLSWNMGPGYHADSGLDTLTFSPTLRQSGTRWNTGQGVSVRHDRLDVTQFRDMARRNRTGSAELERTIADLFADGDWEPLDSLKLNAAARISFTSLKAAARNVRRPQDPLLNFDRSTTETNSAFQLGAHWTPAPDTALWLRYDRLYRLPSMDEVAAYQGYPLSEPFNDRLRAETGHNVELGGEWTSGKLGLKANAFLQTLHGEIAYDYIRNLNINLASTRRIGAELEAAWRAENWSATVAYSAVDARFTGGPYDGRKIYLVPAHQLLSSLELRPWDFLTARLEHQWQAACHEGNDLLNNQPKLPAFQVFNLALQCRPERNTTCYLRVSNLFDKRYATLKYSGVWYPAAGRQFQIGIRHEF